MPPPCVTQTASHTQKPRTFADSPTIEPASGVKLNMPFSERAGSLGRMRPASGGSRRAASASAGAKSSGVNGMREGCMSPPGARIADCGVAIGSWW